MSWNGVIKLNIYQMVLILIAVFIPINLLKDLFPIPLTLIVGGMILILMMWIIVANLSKQIMIILVVPIMLSVVNAFFSDNIGLHFRYFLNWYSLLCTLILCSQSFLVERFEAAYNQIHKSVNIIVVGTALLTIGLLMLPQAYSGGWWGLSNGFVAFTISHAVAASMCALAGYAILYVLKKGNIKLSLILLLISSFAIFQTGARTYVISIFAVFLIFVFDIIKNKKVRFLVVLCGIFFVLFIMDNSSFMEKMNITNSYQKVNNANFASAISSGRTEFWKIDFQYFSNSDFVKQILGNGFACSFMVNRLYYGMEIFSHNIYIETMLSLGGIGFLILMYLHIRLFKTNIIDYVSFTSLFIYVVLIGFVNGLMDSQIYCYSILIICLIFRAKKKVRCETKE